MPGRRLAVSVALLSSLAACAAPGTGRSSALPAARLDPEPPPSPEPLPAVEPRSLSLDGGWRFRVDPGEVGEAEGWPEPGLADGDWLQVEVPHTWNLMPGHRDYEGLAWYRRTFPAPAEAARGRARLRFGAAFYLARVWLNGHYLGQHEGGYTAFEFDVTPWLRAGQPNLLAVAVDNARSANRIPARLSPSWSFDWWNDGGLVRSVSLEVTSRAHLAGQRIVAVPHLTGTGRADRAEVQLTVTVVNTSTAPLEGRLRVEILHDQGASVTHSEAPLTVPASARTAVDLELGLDEPRLWHFDAPHLYRSRVVLEADDGRRLHWREDTFGVRKIELRDARLLLNGEPVRLVGLTRHADGLGGGLAEGALAMARDFDDLKALNTVLSRPVHYPQHEFILDYADRQGILLIPEVPAWQLTALQMSSPRMRELEKAQLQEMIEQQFNHPSVWAWSIGNEIESDTGPGHAFVQEMIAFVKELDPTRPVSFASNRLGSRPERDAAAHADFLMMNQYFGTWAGPKQELGPALDRIHALWPDKVVIVSEYGFEPRWREIAGTDLDGVDPQSFYLLPDGAGPDSAQADALRQELIREQLEVLRRRPFVAGAVFWTYHDYRTRSGFVMGVVDAQRRRRGSWQVLRSEQAPLVVESMEVSQASNGRQGATLRLRSREDLPTYALAGYSLRWRVVSTRDGGVVEEGSLDLPRLAPGAGWAGRLEWPAPAGGSRLGIAVLRPTGFTVLEGQYDQRGRPLDGR